MTDTQTFGFDRQVEDQQITNQPPRAVGNPGATSLADRLKAKFAGRDKQRTVLIEGHTKAGESVWLELDLDVSEAELKRFRDAGKNRAGRRGKNATSNEDLSQQAMAARAINEKNTRVWLDEPTWDAKTETYTGHLEDEDGDEIVVRSDEWLDSLNATRAKDAPVITDPEDGLVELFGFAGLMAIFEKYDAEATGPEARVVDPTRATSGG